MREHLALLKHHMVLHLLQDHALGLQGLGHGGVPRAGGGLVVLGGKHGLHAQRLGQLRYLLARISVQHDQAGRSRSRNAAQRRIQLHQGLAYELHAPVLARQRLQNRAVEDEHAVHLRALRQGRCQGRVVLQAQIAA